MGNGLGYASPIPNYFEFCPKLAAALVALVVGWSFFVRVRNRKLPPGPFPLPILGNMLYIPGGLPHQALAALSLKFGPLMSLYFGSKLVLVISSPEMAREFMKTGDLLFASRPPAIAGNYLMYNYSDVASAPYGPYWRQMRKVCVLQLLSSKRLDYFRFIRKEEVSVMIRSITNNSDHPINIGQTVSTLTKDIICRMTFGRKYSDHDFIGNKGVIAMIKETFLLLGEFNIGDYIPYLAWMDLQGIKILYIFG